MAEVAVPVALEEDTQQLTKLRNRFFIMRHGQSEANVQGLIVCSPDTGCREYGLTDLGRSQVKKTSQELKSLLEPNLSPVGDLQIVSSDFKRTSESAELVRTELGVRSSVHYEPALRERDFGRLNLSRDANYKEVWKFDVEDPTHTEYSCESVTAVVLRLSRVIQELDREFQNKAILLVSHGDPLQIISCIFAGLPPNYHKSLPNLVPAGLRELKHDLLHFSVSP